MAVPTVGQLVIEMAMYRFASNLSLLLKSGVPMMETMYTIKGIFQNSPIYRDALERVAAKVAAGKPLVRGAQGDRIVPADAGQHGPGRRGIGPTRGRDGADRPVLQGKNGRHDPESHENGGALTIMCMGSSIAGLMLAIYMPMFDMAGNVK